MNARNRKKIINMVFLFGIGVFLFIELGSFRHFSNQEQKVGEKCTMVDQEMPCTFLDDNYNAEQKMKVLYTLILATIGVGNAPWMKMRGEIFELRE